MSEPLLRIQDLHVWFPTARGKKEILVGVDLELRAGAVVYLTGSSGAGKSLLARAALGLLPASASWSGKITWEGRQLERSSDWRGVRGQGMTLVLQEPRTALNPVFSVGDQLSEVIKSQGGQSGSSLSQTVVDLLAEVRIPHPERVSRLYPHQLSGGMRQRILLAGALACRPKLLFADEITSALDAANRRSILSLLEEIRQIRGMGVLLITHDMELHKGGQQRLLVLEKGMLKAVSPGRGLGPSVLRTLSQERVKKEIPVLQARNIQVVYATPKGSPEVAVAGVDLDLTPGRMVGLAGESGCGKSSLALALSRHITPAVGQITIEGQEFLAMTGVAFRRMRRKVQLLFQDPGASLDPRQTVASAVTEACASDDPTQWVKLLAEVGLGEEFGSRYPHQLSGGQRQRVALARCLAAEPQVLIADEPTTQLDGATRDRIIALLRQVMEARGLAVLMISHDLPLLLANCAEVRIMLGGRIVEWVGSPEVKLVHPYSLQLFTGGTGGDSSLDTPLGIFLAKNTIDACVYFGRCPLAKPGCGRGLPPLRDLSAAQQVRCYELP